MTSAVALDLVQVPHTHAWNDTNLFAWITIEIISESPHKHTTLWQHEMFKNIVVLIIPQAAKIARGNVNRDMNEEDEKSV